MRKSTITLFSEKSSGVFNFFLSVSFIICSVVAIAQPYNDGASNASRGPAQRPTLFFGYCVRPPWQVAGVDYAVGIDSGTVLKNPVTCGCLPTGASRDEVNHLIRVTANNVVLDGFDFYTYGRYNVYIDGSTNSVTGTQVKNCYFYGGVPVTSHGTVTNTSITHNTIDGAGVNDTCTGCYGECIYVNGDLTVEYNWIKNVQQHFVSTGGAPGGTLNYRFNLLEDGGWVTGAHLNYLQWSGNAVSNNPKALFNTMVQHVTLAGGEGFQMEEQAGSTGSINNAEVAYNTLIAISDSLGTKAESYILHTGSSNNNPAPATGTVHENYIDASGAYGAFYPGLTGFTYCGDINMKTCAHLDSVCITTGINKYTDLNLVNIYPNPSREGIFNVQGNSTSSIEVYNMLGESVFKMDAKWVASKGNKLDLTNMPNGMYFLQLKTGTEMVTRKIVINK